MMAIGGKVSFVVTVCCLCFGTSLSLTNTDQNQQNQQQTDLTMPASLCPSHCACQKRTVRCSKMYRIPTLLKNTSELYMNGNFLGPDINGSLADLHELKVVDLSRNNIRRLQNNLLTGLVRLKVINLQGNFLTELPDDFFTTNSDLEILDLSENQFNTFPGKSFRYLIHLTKLDLSRNQLISPFLGIRFQVMVRLSELDLSYNNFRNVPANSFNVVKKWDAMIPKYINLSYSNIETVERDAFSGIRGLYQISLAGNLRMNNDNLTLALSQLQDSGVKLLDISYMGITNMTSALSNFTQAQLKMLNLSHNAIEQLPDDSFDFLVSLENLDLSWNSLTTLAGGIKELENLKELDVSNNRLTALAAGYIDRQKALRSLNLSNNFIIKVNKTVFFSLKKLHTLDLSNNNIETFDLSGDMSTSLQILNLAGNNIIQPGPSINLPKLRHLDFSRNKIKKLDAFVLRNSDKIEFVNFSRNHIMEINHQVFKPHVPQRIDLSFNFLYSIKNFDWIHATEIYLQGNLIRTIDFQAFFAMNTLRVLDLSQNQIQTIDKDTFNYLTNVTTLNLQNNQITLDPKDASLFRYMSNLEHLDMSKNDVSKLRPSLFTRCEKLKFLSLARNQLSSINPEVFSALKKLQELHLEHNPYRCGCKLLDFKLWIHMTDLKTAPPINQSLVCNSPVERSGVLIRDFVVTKFECNHILVYLVIFCTLVGLGLVVCAFSAIVCHYYRHWKENRSLPDSDESYQYDETLSTEDKGRKSYKQKEHHGSGILKDVQCNGYVGLSEKDLKARKPVFKIKSKLKRKKQPKRSNSVTFGLPISRTADYIMTMENRDWPVEYGGPPIRRSKSFDLRRMEEPIYAQPRKNHIVRPSYNPAYGSLGRRHSAYEGYSAPRTHLPRRQTISGYNRAMPLPYDRHTVDIYGTARRRPQPVNPSVGDYLDLPLVTYRRRNTPPYYTSATLPRNIGRHQSLPQITSLPQRSRSYSNLNGGIPSSFHTRENSNRIEWV